MPNIPLPSSRYCPAEEFHASSTSHIMPCHPFCLHTWAEGWRNQSVSCQLQYVATMISIDFLSPAVEVVFSCILVLVDIEQRQRKQLKKLAQSLQPCCARSDCTDKKSLCSNSVIGFSQFLGSKRPVSAPPYAAPEPGMRWDTPSTPVTIGEHDPVWVKGRNISSENYMFPL